MIITCLNCYKKFNIEEKLIPKNGRLLQCGACNHKWHYKLPNQEKLTEDKIIVSKENNQIHKSEDKEILISPSLLGRTNDEKRKKINKDLNKKKKNIKDVNELHSSTNILNSLIIIIITFVAIILILDTFKKDIAIYAPFMIQFLDNFYEIFFDIKAFTIDLFN